MSLMMMLVGMGRVASAPQTYTRTFNSSESYVVPAGVTMLDKIEGKGQDGQPSSYGPSTPQTMIVAEVYGETDRTSQTRSTALRTWEYFTTHAYGMVGKVNAGGSGMEPAGYLNYIQYPDRTVDLISQSTAWADAIAGSASFVSISWNFNGSIFPGDFGTAAVQYSRRGAFIPATTGASASAFGKTFPGGTGGTAALSGHTSVPVTPGATYQVTVPSGGFITITYKK